MNSSTKTVRPFRVMGRGSQRWIIEVILAYSPLASLPLNGSIEMVLGIWQDLRVVGGLRLRGGCWYRAAGAAIFLGGLLDAFRAAAVGVVGSLEGKDEISGWPVKFTSWRGVGPAGRQERWVVSRLLHRGDMRAHGS